MRAAEGDAAGKCRLGLASGAWREQSIFCWARRGEKGGGAGGEQHRRQQTPAEPVQQQALHLAESGGRCRPQEGGPWRRGAASAKKRSSGSPLPATVGSQARSSTDQPLNTRTFLMLPAWNEPSSLAGGRGVEVAHRARLVGDDDGKRVEAVAEIDRNESVAGLGHSLTPFKLGRDGQIEDGDKGDDRHREQDRERARKAHRRALEEVIDEHASRDRAWCSPIRARYGSAPWRRGGRPWCAGAEMWVSTTLVRGSKWKLHTRSKSMVRVSTRPLLRIRTSSRRNSRGCRSMGAAARHLAGDEVHLRGRRRATPSRRP